MTLLRALVVLAFACANAAAAVELQKLGWQMTPVQGPRAQVKTAKPIERLLIDPVKGKVPGRLLGWATLLNRGTPTEGILLRYSVTGKIAPMEGGHEPAWVLPYMLETRRVPRAAANRHLEVPLDATALTELYLKKLRREGYSLKELKMQVMLEPRKGVAGPVQLLEAVLPVEEGAP